MKTIIARFIEERRCLTRYPMGGGAACLTTQQQARAERQAVLTERLKRNIGRA